MRSCKQTRVEGLEKLFRALDALAVCSVPEPTWGGSPLFITPVPRNLTHALLPSIGTRQAQVHMHSGKYSYT